MKKTPLNDAERPAVDAEPVLTRERIVRAASRLMQRQGYDGTGVKQISQEARATLGSVYHFFPGGKMEIAVAAIHHGDQEFSEELRVVLDSEPDPARAVASFTHHLAESLRASDWIDGCPITTTALGAVGRLPKIQEAAADAFTRWREIVRVKLLESGIGETEAHELAHTVISTLEGAELAAQVSQDSEPLDLAGRHLAQLITSYQ
ncbi:TetR/AcrR family transcriptional regulator [Streptomyces sp. SID3212]|uniref:TetR/AcrR family transcriptional regulator n=1 Tax=unclassified Streptomyces TaxID=2593676 RepID=UPI00136FEB78|nr:TetR/AcrR family transcriptional regulator [Streptomyces sp. SID3212]MYV56858.1 TetR family transcriptional regulator [Streptomyces sp. SID3212]